MLMIVVWQRRGLHPHRRHPGIAMGDSLQNNEKWVLYGTRPTGPAASSRMMWQELSSLRWCPVSAKQAIETPVERVCQAHTTLLQRQRSAYRLIPTAVSRAAARQGRLRGTPDRVCGGGGRGSCTRTCGGGGVEHSGDRCTGHVILAARAVPPPYHVVFVFCGRKKGILPVLLVPLITTRAASVVRGARSTSVPSSRRGCRRHRAIEKWFAERSVSQHLRSGGSGTTDGGRAGAATTAAAAGERGAVPFGDLFQIVHRAGCHGPGPLCLPLHRRIVLSRWECFGRSYILAEDGVIAFFVRTCEGFVGWPV